MSPVYPTLPRLAVRDSFDDEDLSDVDDEVFIRDGRNGGLKLDDEGGVKRPLMAPRRKCKINRSMEKRRLTCKSLVAPCCYGTMALLILTGLISLVIFAVSVFPMPLAFLKNLLAQTMQEKVTTVDEIAACTSLAASIVWTRSLPKLTSEAPLRSLDVNEDKIDDVIVAFSTGLNDLEAPQDVCNVYFGGQTPCLAGILALDGETGETVWTHWSWHVIFSLDCALDLNSDEIKDCVAGGRGGTLRAVSGRDGSTIWSLEEHEKSKYHRILDVYDANYISDLDGDEVGDIIAAHTMQTGAKRSSDIVLVSGKTGLIIRRIPMKNEESLYLAPQTLVHPDGEKILVLVTGSHEQAGGLYVASFSSLLHGELQLQELSRSSGNGILSQPILADINEDGTEDIIAAMFNSLIVAYNGRTFEELWRYVVLNSEIISSPIPGYYNDDDVPDFMVKHQLGLGYPVYYYTVAQILDGKTGKPLLEKELEDSLSGQMSGLSVTVEGYGNDWFLHWSADCLGHEGDRSPYQFLKTTSLASQIGADLCKLRFNSTLSSKLLALSQHVAPPGLPLYASEEWRKLEYNSSIDPRKEAERYSELHPDYEGLSPELGVSSITERSLRVHSSRRGRPGGPKNDEKDIFSEQTNFYTNSKSLEIAKAKDSLANNPETNVSDDFGSNEDWRDVNKWDDDGKDYNVLYDEEEDEDKSNGIREQRSGSIDAKEMNNDTNDLKNELDSSMDYTNGQTEDNYQSSIDFNRTKTVQETPRYSSDFDFDKNIKDQSAVQSKEKRSTEFEGSISGPKGQKEIIVGNMKNSDTYELFLKIIKRPTEELVPNKNESKTLNDVEASFLLEKITVDEKSSLNISVGNSNETGEVSELLEPVSQIIERELNATERENATVPEKKNVTKEAWLTGDIFSKLMRNSEEDENIEKIFKRESMKNRKGFGDNRLTKMERIENSLRIKTKREATPAESQMESADGVQRQPPTGILLPSLNKLEKVLNSVDLVFSTSWLPPSDASVILVQQDLDCIRRKRKESQSLSPRGVKNPQQRAQFVLECLGERGIDYKVLQEGTDRENVKIPLGQMTIYRMKLECVCPEDMLKGQTCRSISPQQSWPAHLGSLENGYFKPLRRPAS